MSLVTYNALKLLGKAYELKTDTAIEMFDDLWEVYQVGNKYRRDNKKALQDEVEKSYSTLTEIIRRTNLNPGGGFRRIGTAQNTNLVIFSDQHMTHRGHRHDYFFNFNFKLYCDVLRHYADRGFALVENGDLEELLIFNPTPDEAERRRKLVRKPWGIDDIGEINWDELVGVRIETRRKQLENILNDNSAYYKLVKDSFGKSRYYKIAGNHDGYYSAEMEGMIEAEFWDGVVKDVLLVERKTNNKVDLDFVITHGHQFDESCAPPHAKAVGEVISECLSWAFQGPDRIWRVSDTHKWNSNPVKEFSNVLSSESATTTGHPDLEVILEAFMGHEVAWEYFENEDPYMAFVKEVCTGDEFFKYRHMNEDALANAILRLNQDLEDFPTVICGHTHEPRDRSKFHNSTNRLPPDTNDRNLFTRYMNTGSAGRFENLIWCIEITGSKAKIYSWSNSGTEGNPVMKKVRWKSDDEGKLIGREVEFSQRAQAGSH
jgi:predicted phosphodiesterase